jgi:transporter family-2 protein
MKFLLLPLIVLVSLVVPVQFAANARLEESVDSPALALLLAFAIGTVALFILTMSGVLGRGDLAAARDVPWWSWLGGLLSVCILMTSMIAVKSLGTGAVVSALVFGQLTSAMVIDHFGWLDVEQNPISAYKIAGAVFLCAGALLMQHK